MKSYSPMYLLIIVLMMTVLLSTRAGAVPSAQFLYAETDLGGGIWQYNYTLFNTSDPLADAGFDAYDVFLSFDSSAALTVASLPAGWDSISGAALIETLSLNPGEPPLGTDVAPGSSVGGFIFQFEQRMAALPFDVTLANPNDPENPVVLSSLTEPLNVPVPECASLLYLVIGLVGLGVTRIGRRSRNHVLYSEADGGGGEYDLSGPEGLTPYRPTKNTSILPWE